MAAKAPENITSAFRDTGADGNADKNSATSERTAAPENVTGALSSRWNTEDQRLQDDTRKKAQDMIDAADGKYSEAQGAVFQSFMNVFMKGRADTAFMFQLMMQCYQLLKAGEQDLKAHLAYGKIARGETDKVTGIRVGGEQPAAPAFRVGAIPAAP